MKNLTVLKPRSARYFQSPFLSFGTMAASFFDRPFDMRVSRPLLGSRQSPRNIPPTDVLPSLFLRLSLSFSCIVQAILKSNDISADVQRHLVQVYSSE